MNGMIRGLGCLAFAGAVGLGPISGLEVVAEQPASKARDVLIVATFYPVYVMTLNITRDVPGVRVACMAPPETGCLHHYQLRPEDLKTLASAQILVANGAGMESFLAKAIKQAPHLKVIEACRGIDLIREGDGEHGDYEDHGSHPGHDHHGRQGQPNPHVWVSVTGAIAQVNSIAGQLGKADPARAAAYRKNAGVYVAKLEALRARMHEGLRDAKGVPIITFHEAFPYFAREFGLKIAGVVEQQPGTEPSAGELAALVRTVRRMKVKALFAEPQYPVQAAETIARETGIKVYMLDPAVAGPMDPPEVYDAYIRTMENNLLVLEKALK
mgnify:CR=1 FL=1